MKVSTHLAVAILLVIIVGVPARVAGQAPPAGRGAAARRAGGFVPGQQRPPGDPARSRAAKRSTASAAPAATARICAAAIWAGRTCCARKLR